MKNPSRNGKSAFTLIELLAVITIIVILAALVVGGLGFVNERQAREKAKVQIGLLSRAIEEYKLDMGYYPPITSGNASDPSLNSNQLYQALFYHGYSYAKLPTPPTTWTNATKIYLPDLDPTTSKQGWIAPLPAGATAPPTAIGNTDLKDPWGNPYRYRPAANVNPVTGAVTVLSNTINPDFDLWSVGKDTLTSGGPNDIDHKNNRDDIRN